MSAPSQQTGLSHCSIAATSAEVRYRIDGHRFIPRATMVFSLDTGAERLLQPYHRMPWQGARFFAFDGDLGAGSDGSIGDATLRSSTGDAVLLSAALRDADVTVMVATADTAAPRAAAVGQACAANGIMTAGVVVPGDGSAERAVTSLRPFATVLLVSAEVDDIPEVLMALRA